MRYAVLCDVHSNLEALQAVLEDMRGETVDQLLCGGDTVGYGAAPNECLAALHALWPDCEREACVLGNHDGAVLGGDIGALNPLAQRAALWTRAVLNAEHRDWLSRLPLVCRTPDLLLVHASAHAPHQWVYVRPGKDGAVQRCALAAWQEYNRPISVVGHSHQPFVALARLDQPQVETHLVGEGSVALELPDNTAGIVINAGSVGQPRDGDPRACYALLAFSERKVTVALRRVKYDVERARNAIWDAGLPTMLGERLLVGY